MLDAFRAGNELIFINDYRMDPLSDSPDINQLPFHDANVMFVQISIFGWPHIIVVSISKISKGEELFVDYSDNYWEKIRDDLQLISGHQQVWQKIQEWFFPSTSPKFAIDVDKKTT